MDQLNYALFCLALKVWPHEGSNIHPKYCQNFLMQIGGCGAKISLGYDPGVVVPVPAYLVFARNEGKICFQERLFGPQYKLLQGGGEFLVHHPFSVLICQPNQCNDLFVVPFSGKYVQLNLCFIEVPLFP